VLTCITAQNTYEVSKILPLPEQLISAQLDSLARDLHVVGVKIGMLYSPDIVALVAQALQKKFGAAASSAADLPIIVDPVMTASVGAPLIDTSIASVLEAAYEKFVESFKRHLRPLSTIVTPNLLEASKLVGWEVRTVEDMKKASSELQSLGWRGVLIKGGHLTSPQAEVVDVLCYDGELREFRSPRLGEGAHGTVHGTGCCFASLLLGTILEWLLKLQPTPNLTFELVVKAVETARARCAAAVRHAYHVGRGLPVVRADAALWNAAERYKVLEQMQNALEKLKKITQCEYIPEVGTNLAFALPYAATPMDVCAVKGRLIRAPAGVFTTGEVGFGASEHMAKLLLEAMKFAPEVRCAMNLKYLETMLQRAIQLGYSVGEFKRAEEPKGVSTLRWCVQEVYKKLGRVPDVIYDLGAKGKEPMIRLLGKDPEDVLRKLIRLQALKS
jgi:hydroxymethylpyrimidine/phosphomethylpyrimidine kinase